MIGHRRIDRATRATFRPGSRSLLVEHKGVSGRFEFGAELDLSDSKTRRWLSDVLAEIEVATRDGAVVA